MPVPIELSFEESPPPPETQTSSDLTPPNYRGRFRTGVGGFGEHRFDGSMLEKENRVLTRDEVLNSVTMPRYYVDTITPERIIKIAEDSIQDTI